ncbi:MAG TPA: M28 family peptidase [Candidatus Binataceae bacterium]|nr:M28 family peptidase [Candidatus Binataceae bacterium]
MKRDGSRRVPRAEGLGSRAALASSQSSRSAGNYPGMPANDEVFGWVTDLWRFGDQSKYGYRMPGTAADQQAAQYIERKFQEFGLDDVRREPMNVFTSFPDRWSLKISVNGGSEDLPCCFVRYAAFTPQEGITGELVHVGDASEEQFATRNVAGKIVVVDLLAPSGYYDDGGGGSILYAYDPRGTLGAPRGSNGFPVLNLASSIDLARRRGAIGYIGILTFRANDDCQEYHGPKYGNQVITAVTISPASGEYLRKCMASRPVRGTIVLTEQPDIWRTSSFGSWGVTYNLYGVVPGTSKEMIVVMSHHDGGATNEASGVSVVMALARYFAGLPKPAVARSLLFFARGSHFGLRPPLLDGCPALAAVKDSVVCVMNIEMVGRQMDLVAGKYLPTELIAPTRFGISTAHPRLVSIVQKAIERHGLERTVIASRLDGEGVVMKMAGFWPVIERISLNAPQFSSADTPATVMKEALRPTACAFADIIAEIDRIPAHELRATEPERA